MHLHEAQTVRKIIVKAVKRSVKLKSEGCAELSIKYDSLRRHCENGCKFSVERVYEHILSMDQCGKGALPEYNSE